MSDKHDKHAEVKKRKMTAWYDPRLLIGTGLDTALSTIFGKRSDFRVIEAFGAHAKSLYDYSEHEQLWVDYASDVGDGWNSTYAVARALAATNLPLQAPDGTVHATARGGILVLGGDQVYPLASREHYFEGFVTPYEAAFPETALPDTDLPTTDSPAQSSPTSLAQQPHMFAIPGNHDWYDSLVSFSRLFCTQRKIGGWQTRQACSYFAIKLPHGWWLVGTDVQLDADLDHYQIEYFQGVAEQMAADDRVILCNAQPYWVTEKKYRKFIPNYMQNNLQYLQEKVFEGRVRIFLAGDMHHYRRFEHVPLTAEGNPRDDEKMEMITAGGGGAFLHPTHDIAFTKIENEGRELEIKQEYPDRATSRRLSYRNLLFFWKNFSFGFIPAIVYFFTAWTFASYAGYGVVELDYFERWHIVLQTMLYNPLSSFWVILIFLGCWLYSSLSHVKAYRWTVGIMHGAVNIVAVFTLGWIVAWWTTGPLGLAHGSTAQMVLGGICMFVGGWLLGSLFMGLYLLFSLNVLGRHSDEAFAALKIEDWKNFLRIHISREGDLTIYPIAIDRVPRAWRRRASEQESTSNAVHASPSQYEPARIDARCEPRLIERPIVIARHPTGHS